LDVWLAGRLRIQAGRLESLCDAGGAVEAIWRPRAARTRERRIFRHVINCTGPEGDPSEACSPLIRQLVDDGLIRADPLGLGMDAAEDGRLIRADGRPHARLFAIGPPARGALWEVTAVPDIRVQARRLGQALASLSLARSAAWQA
jgi:uncharacterized NAD(P)/FAD-binding protein YdhS